MRDQAVRDYIDQARWFGGKGTTPEIGEIRELPLGILLVDVGGELYQLPTSSYEEEQPSLEHALIGEWDDLFHYDAVHDRSAMASWLAAFDDGGPSPLRFTRMPGHELDHDAPASAYSGEQSNSSVMFGEDSILKIFRRVTVGANPDIEIHRALTAAGSEHVAHLYGWIELDTPEGPMHLGMLQQFLRTATDGWSVARASVRNLLAEADLHPDEVGGDFAPEAHRLGAAVAEVHAVLREAFGSEPLDVDAVVARMHARLEHAAADVPELAECVGIPRDAYEQLAKTGATITPSASAQRIHGDLHLGQTLRTSLGWKLVDFEGEPARPLAERTLPDSVWRDVAGMLRSFDYAAKTAARDFDPDDGARRQSDYRGAEWVERNREAFLAGYAEASEPLSDVDLALIAAYELDKAVYEVTYEAHHRPAWIDIPLSALIKAGEGR